MLFSDTPSEDDDEEDVKIGIGDDDKAGVYV